MLEDSITSSPRKNNSSIHKARLQRKIRRRFGPETEENEIVSSKCDANKTDENEATNNATLQDRVPSLADMYWEGNNHPNNSNGNRTFRVEPQKYVAAFDPFEDELLLAVADRLDCAQGNAQRKKKMEQLKTRQGFHKCSQLLLESKDNVWEDKENKPKSPTKAYKPPIINGPKTQFGITESELLHVCAAAEEEKVEEIDSVEETPPPKRHKSIVESILEDFCSSPLSTDGQELHYSNINKSKSCTGQLLSGMEDRTPVFHFKNKPLRTYSCRRSKTGVRTSIAQRFENVALVNADEDDNLSNCSSGLSVQEDLTQHTEALHDSVEFNKSTKVCENLLNLSAYFTQKSLSDATPPSNSADISQTAQEISPEETDVINSFEYHCVTASKLIQQIITMRKELGFIFSESAHAEIANFRGFSPARKEDDKTILNTNAKTLNTSFDCRKVLDATMMLQEDYCASDVFADEISSRSSLTDRISCDRNDASSLQESINRADELFSDSEDEWHDECDFFKQFKTQDALRCATPPKKFNGFMSAARKPIVISDTAQRIANRILAEVDTNLNPELEVLQKDTACDTIKVPEKQLTLEDQNLPGFQTASNKQIKISEEAKKRALSVLSDFPVIPITCNALNIDEVDLGDIQLSEWLIDDGAEKVDLLKNMPVLKEFETASKKHIQISEAARKHALNILNDIPELSKCVLDEYGSASSSKIPKDFGVPNSKLETNDNFAVCKGFRTASRKSICISAEAKEKAAKILEALPDFPKETEKDALKAAVDFEGIQLSQWPLNDSFKNGIDEAPPTIGTKTKLEHLTDGLEKYSKTPEILGKSLTKNNWHQTPLTPHIDNDPLGARNSSTPLTKNTSFVPSVISRKNLLSLSKRKKIKYNQDIKTLEETLTTKSAGHIVRMTTAPVTPNVQEFFAAVPNTSTPRPLRANCTQTPSNHRRSEVDAYPSEIDMGFKNIEWEAGNDSSTLNNTKTPSSSKFNSLCENITVISANPSPKMRIARLHMYGKPPPVSPILMSSSNNCRPSGLRRGRSMQKQ